MLSFFVCNPHFFNGVVVYINRTDAALTDKIRQANSLDVVLYEWSVLGFCDKLCKNKLGGFDKYNICRC